MMRRLFTASIVLVLALAGNSRADLMVYEYVTDQKVTLDTETGNYWYWDMAAFVYKTYTEQMTAIARMDPYGGVDGGWHMATLEEMQDLWIYDAEAIASSFLPTFNGTDWLGRFDWTNEDYPGTHNYGWVANLGEIIPGEGDYYFKGSFGPAGDEASDRVTGAWVVTDQAVVPVPGAVLLGMLGLSVAGMKLRKYA